MDLNAGTARLLFIVKGTWHCSTVLPIKLQKFKKCPASLKGKVEKG